MAFLYIVATPIGNLKDISSRALEVLKGADLILCEGTQVTQKLLNHFGINTKTLSYHQHSTLKKTNYILKLLKQGKNLALVCNAGTPGISDPGNKLIEEVIESLGDKVKIVPIPGPSALITAASIAGFWMDKFLFLGFPPTKRKRKKFFEEVINSKHPVIFYESPYRILKSLCDLNKTEIKTDTKPHTTHNTIGNRQARKIVVCRELTKKFETIYRGTIPQVIEKIENPPVGEKIKGEFVIIVEGK